MPGELRSRFFAPSLIVPLVALASRRAAQTASVTRITVRARGESGCLIVDVADDNELAMPNEVEPALVASMRARIVALYGSSAALSFAVRPVRGSLARIIIPDPGTL